MNLWTESGVRRGTIHKALTELGFIPVQTPPFTTDFCQVDNEFYWRFPEYLAAAERKRLVRTLPDSRAQAAPHFEYQPHKHQTELRA